MGTFIACEESVTVSNRIVAVLSSVPHVDMFSWLCQEISWLGKVKFAYLWELICFS